MHVIQLFNRQMDTFDRFRRANRETLDAHLQTVFYFSLFVPIVELTNALSIVLILMFSGVLVPEGAITIGVMVAFLQYAQRFFRPLRDLSQKYNILQAAIASSERVFGVLDETDIIPDPEDGIKPDRVQGKIEFDGVWFAYREEDWVLQDVSFTIAPGEHVAIVGATGAGKTTLINLICRFYHPQKGTIRLDGVDIRDIPKDTLRDFIGLIQQDAYIFSGTVGDNIALGRPEYDGERLTALFDTIRLDDFIARLPAGINEEVGERGSRFSAGEKQLISFARAISYDPRILILDEATSNIDTDTELIIRKSTEEMIRDRTAILIAHRLSTIQSAHRVLVFHKGKLREEGRDEELLEKNGIYARLYTLYYAKNA